MDKLVITIDQDLEELIPGFLENRKQDIKTLNMSLEQEDFETIRLLGHSMKGFGAGYGFDFISRIGLQLETAAKSQERARIQSLVLELEVDLKRIDIVFE